MNIDKSKFKLAQQIAADEYQFIFGNPGTTEHTFLAALESQPNIRYINTLHETVAVAAADAFSRVSGRASLVQLHASVGLGNGIGMLYHAYQGNSPLVVIAGEADLKYQALRAHMGQADLVEMAKPVTKFAARVVDSGSLLRTFRQAKKAALMHPRGPAFIALPMDILENDNGEDVYKTELPSYAPLADKSDISKIADILAGAKKPVIIVGDNIALGGAQEELTRLAERLDAPVWGAQSYEVNIRYDHPLFRGPFDVISNKKSTNAVKDADVVLIAGTYVFPELFPETGSPFNMDAKVIHIDSNPENIGKNHRCHMGAVCDLKAMLGALYGEVSALGKKSSSDVIVGVPNLAVTGKPHLLSEFLYKAKAALTKQSPDYPPIFFDEAISNSGKVTSAIYPQHTGEYFQARGGSLGSAIPGGIGIKLARPDHPVVSISGDGGSLYTFQALWTAQRYGVGGTFVICNNGSYKLLENNAKILDSEFRPSSHIDNLYNLFPPAIDYVMLAQAFGVHAMAVSKKKDIDTAIKIMLQNKNQPFLIDLKI